MPAITQYHEVRFDANAEGCWPDAVQEDPKPGEMHVLYKDGIAYMCEYMCPCGCGAPCPTFFVRPDRPRTGQRPLWDFTSTPAGPTLSPSVRHLGGCKSHYNITCGRVYMHAG